MTTLEPNGRPKLSTKKPVNQNSTVVTILESDDRAYVRRFLENRFTLDELATLAFDRGVNYQALPHATTAQLSMALVDHFERRNNINYLLAEVLRQRYDYTMAQLCAKLPSGAPHPKVQITLAPGIQVNPDELVADLADKCKVDIDQVQLISAAWSSLRLLVSLPQEAADGLLSSGIQTLVNASHDITSIVAFDALGEANQKPWRLLAARYPSWPPVPWNGMAQTDVNHSPPERLPIIFGTDGWRAVISDEFTFANVRRVAQAIAEVLLENARASANGRPADAPLAVVGFDTRFLSDRYAWAVSEVLAGNGMRVALTKSDAPTPVVSFAIPHMKAVGGVMITASHNPPRYNGIKLKSAYGGSATVADTKRVEAKIVANLAENREPRRMEMDEAIATGLVKKFDPLPAYREHLQHLIDFDMIRRGRLHVAMDAMYGTGRGYIRDLLTEAGAQVTEIRGEMNPGFNGIHPEPIAKHLKPLMDLMATGEFHLGLATDGDADRIGAVGPTGRFIDPHCIMTLALRYLVEVRGWSGAVVKTVSTTQMLNRLASQYGLALHETPVGFNHIGDLMMTEDVLIGGEESGGISIKGHIPEGDGVLMGLLMAEIVAHYGKSPETLLAEVMAEIGQFDYARNDFKVRSFEKNALVSKLTELAPATLAGSPLASINLRDGVKYVMANNSWLLIRPSGTEPMLRVYAEAHSPETVQTLLAEGRALADSAGV